MDWIAATLVTAVVTFVVTNIDDILILTIFFSELSPSFLVRHIVAGQYLGFSAIVTISLLGFLAGLVIPREWIGLLGFLPIYIGIRKLVHRSETVEPVQVSELEQKTSRPPILSGILSRQTLGVATVTIANGGDNIGIYTPLFANSDLLRLMVILSVFYILIGMWCYLGFHLANRRTVAQLFSRYGHVFVPFVLICLGVLILLESESYMLIGWD
jgi:cadmium resistance transport/sequestration family protein